MQKMIVNDLTNQEKTVSLEVDKIACKSLLLWIQLRQQFVGEIDFGDV
jgi:predicted acetyltransferase